MCYFEKLSKATEAYNLQPGVYSSVNGIVEAMNTIIPERNNHRDTCITIKVSRLTTKVKVYLANEESSLSFFSPDLGHKFGGDVRNDLGIKKKAKICLRYWSHPFTHDLYWHCRVGDTKAPLLRCFPFTSKPKCGDIKTIGLYMKYHTFSNLQFRRLLKNSFHSIHIDLRDTSGEKLDWKLPIGITRLVFMFRKVSDIHLYWN